MVERPVALVTGASRGIGRACALELARRGFHVVAAWVSSEEGAQATLAEIRAAGGQGEAVKLDVGDTRACAAEVERIVAAHGRLDVLVNNAAVSLDALVVRLKDEDWDRQLAVNLTGPMALCRAAARPMMKQRAGSIVNLVSVVGESGNAGQSAYAAAKAGLIGFTKSLALEVARKGVTVNTVSPGYLDSPMVAAVPQNVLEEKILPQIPVGRLGQPAEIAALVTFICSDSAGYMTGSNVAMNGGMY